MMLNIRKLTVLATVLVAVAAQGLGAKDLPAGGSAATLTEGGAYVIPGGASSISYPSLMNGTADPVVLDLMGDPLKTISLTGSKTVFNQTQNDASTSVKGGKIDVSGGNVYVGWSGSATASTKKKMFLSDGAEISGCGTFAVAEKEDGNILAMTNATISAANFYVANGGCKGMASVFAGPGAKINVSGTFKTENGPTGNSREYGRFEMFGEGAELTAGCAEIGAMPDGVFSLGGEAIASFGALYMGTNNAAKAGAGYTFAMTNATVDVTDVAMIGSGKGVTGLNVLAKDSTFSASKLTIGGADDSDGHTVVFDDTEVTLENLSVGTRQTKDQTLILSGSLAHLSHTTSSKVDIFGNGSDCHIIAKDGAVVAFSNGARQLFQTTSASTLEFLNGASLTSEKGVYLGYGGKAWPLDCEPNRIVFGEDAFTSVPIYVYGVNNELVISNGFYNTTPTIGIDAGHTTGVNESTNVALVVQGSSPRIDAPKLAMAGVRPRIRFELAREGYSWEGESADRVAPIRITGTSNFTPTADAVFEADVRKLAPNLRGRDIPVIVSTQKIMNIPTDVIANANARGAAGKYKYSFSVSADKKTLYLNAEPRGLILVFR